VPGHALGDFGFAAVGQIVSNAGRAKSVAAYRRFDIGIDGAARTMYQTSVRDIARGPSFLVLPIAARNSGPWRSSAMPAALI